MDVKKYLMEYYAEHEGYINKNLAEAIVKEMAVTDNSGRETGEKWTMEETTEAGRKAGVDFNIVKECEYYLVMNMFYSDYHAVMHKHGLDSYIIYAELAYAWFTDEDAKENKTVNYFL